MKRCSKCGNDKPLDCFYRREGGRRRSHCKDCMYESRGPRRKPMTDDEKVTARSNMWLKRRYGITLADYEAMLVAQGGGCAICGQPPAARRHHVDHCHKTGRVRGVLCHRCNIHLAVVEDREFLDRAERYLAQQGAFMVGEGVAA